MNIPSKFLWPVLITAGVIIGAVAVVQNMPAKSSLSGLVDSKLKSIVTPKPPLDGNLTPARDLKGTWKSSLSGKGLQVFGKFTTGPAITTVTEDGDMEIIIDSVENNIASGKVRYTNLTATAVATVPKLKTITTKSGQKDTGYLPISIRVSGSALDFGTVKTSGATFTMVGSYTTDIMSGSMTMTLPGYGVLKGEFHLNRQAK
jgi:hypothetical protein